MISWRDSVERRANRASAGSCKRRMRWRMSIALVKWSSISPPGSEKNSYVRNPGGAPANVAIALSRLGKSAAFCGKVGDDDFGCFLQETLEENGVGVACKKRTSEAVTTLVFVSLDKNGNRSFYVRQKTGRGHASHSGGYPTAGHPVV